MKVCHGFKWRCFLNLCLSWRSGKEMSPSCVWRPLVATVESVLVRQQNKKRKRIWLTVIFNFPNVLHTVTVYNTALNTQQSKSISYKIKWEERILMLKKVPLAFHCCCPSCLYIKRVTWLLHAPNWWQARTQAEARILPACTSMLADSHMLPFPVWCLEAKRILTITDLTWMKKPPAVTELIDNVAFSCSSVTSPQINDVVTGFGSFLHQ